MFRAKTNLNDRGMFLYVRERETQEQRERVFPSDSLGFQFDVSVFLVKQKKSLPQSCLKIGGPLKIHSFHGSIKVKLERPVLRDTSCEPSTVLPAEE